MAETPCQKCKRERDRAISALHLIAKALLQHAHIGSNPVAAVMAVTQIHDRWASGEKPTHADVEWPRKPDGG